MSDTAPFMQRDFVASIVNATAAQWAATGSYILPQYALGVETDTQKAKLGDGVSTWADLDYWAPAGSIPGSGTVTNVSSANANATVANPTDTPVITIVSAPKLQTARTIGGTPFDGSANIVPDHSDKLTTARAIGGVNFDGSAAINPNVILVSPQGSDNSAQGAKITGLVNSGGVTQWDTVYLNASSQWVKADANGSGTFPARGLALTTQLTGVAVDILTYGIVRHDAWTWTPGGSIYLSGTAGGLTQTAPSASGDNVQEVGYAIDADTAFFHFSPSYVTLT